MVGPPGLKFSEISQQIAGLDSQTGRFRPVESSNGIFDGP